MKEWKMQRGTQQERPEEIDRTSSPTTVYLRRNITQIRNEAENEPEENNTLEWQYEEQEMTVEEYENMLVMQQVMTQNTETIVESVTQFQKDAVIDEYTMQLVEEGLI